MLNFEQFYKENTQGDDEHDYEMEWSEYSLREKAILLSIKSPDDIKSWEIINTWGEYGIYQFTAAKVNGVFTVFSWEKDDEFRPPRNIRRRQDVFVNLRHFIQDVAEVTEQEENDIFDIYNATLQANKDSGINTDF